MISVIIPLYNKEAIIERTLTSVLSQDYDDFEVIIVDDGSTDNSLSIVERELPQIKRKFNANTNVEIIRQENGGPSKARNTGVKHAKGEWIVFLDADDEFLPGALSHFAELLNKHPQEKVFCSPFIERKGDIIVQKYRYSEGKLKNPYAAYYYNLCFPHTGSTLYSSDILNKCLFDERLRRFEDVEQVFKLFDTTNIYVDAKPVLMINLDYVAASKGRNNILEDYVGYLTFDKHSFWKKMCLYKLYLGERILYPYQINELYPFLRYRVDLLILYKLLWVITKSKFLFKCFLRLNKVTNCSYEFT